jgi:hypothetical protein
MKLVGDFGNGTGDDGVVETDEEEGQVQAQDDKKRLSLLGY